MHPRIEELLTILDNGRHELQSAVESVPRVLRSERPAPDRWSTSEVLEHLNLVERRIAVLIARQTSAARSGTIRRETGTSSVADSLDRFALRDRSRRIRASENAQPKGTLDADAALAALAQTRTSLREVVIDADGLALGDLVQPHPVLGPLTMYQWVLFVAHHEQRHADQIREIASSLPA